MRKEISNMSKPIQDFIDTLGDRDHAVANTQFKDIMLGKLGDAMDAEKIRLAGSIYNAETEDEVQSDDEEITEE